MGKKKSRNRIDFAIRPLRGQNVGGLTIFFVPHWDASTDYNPDNYNLEEGVWMHETAYCFIEQIIFLHFPSYLPWGRWGITCIPSSVWLDIVKAMRAMAGMWENAEQLDDVVDSFKLEHVLSSGAACYKYYVSHRFAEIRRNLIIFIGELADWIETMIQRYAVIGIHGI